MHGLTGGFNTGSQAFAIISPNCVNGTIATNIPPLMHKIHLPSIISAGAADDHDFPARTSLICSIDFRAFLDEEMSMPLPATFSSLGVLGGRSKRAEAEG